MENLNVSPEQMNWDADGFYEIYTVSNEITSYLRNGISRLGNFYGNDDFGAKFLETWQPGVDGLVETTDGIGTGMKTTSTKITDSASLYKTSNDVNNGLVR
ncbi:MAG TPA: hypothetical protein VGI74_26540 [Streptosporangiaceae bacterium]|jgi:hypothetical protein